MGESLGRWSTRAHDKEDAGRAAPLEMMNSRMRGNEQRAMTTKKVASSKGLEPSTLSLLQVQFVGETRATIAPTLVYELENSR